MNKTSITYNRNTSQWELLGEIGEILATFPAGPAGHRDAICAQLELEAPEALVIALDMEKSAPSLAGRALRAAQIVATNGAILTTTSAARWRVRSQRNPKGFYTVHQMSATARWPWRCNCQEWSRGEAGASNGAPSVRCSTRLGPLCKHIVAIMVHLTLGRTVQWPPVCPDCGLPMVVKRRRDGLIKAEKRPPESRAGRWYIRVGELDRFRPR